MLIKTGIRASEFSWLSQRRPLMSVDAPVRENLIISVEPEVQIQVKVKKAIACRWPVRTARARSKKSADVDDIWIIKEPRPSIISKEQLSEVPSIRMVLDLIKIERDS